MKARENGHSDAQRRIGQTQFSLGCKHANGEGAPTDLVQALAWFQITRASGHSSHPIQVFLEGLVLNFSVIREHIIHPENETEERILMNCYVRLALNEMAKSDEVHLPLWAQQGLEEMGKGSTYS